MKNFLTKAFVCAGVVASALALSSVAVFAATESVSDDNKIKTLDFSSNSEATISAGNEIACGVINDTSSQGTIKLEKNDINVKVNGVINVPVPQNSSGKITIYGTATNNTVAKRGDGVKEYRYMVIEGTDGTNADEDIVMNTSGTTADFASSITSDGYITFKSHSDFKFNKIVIELTDGTFESVVDYTLSGSVSGLIKDAEFTLTSGNTTYTLKADGNGNATATQQKVFETGEYTVSKADYSCDPESVTISAGSDSTHFNFTTITFTEILLEPLPESKTYTGTDILSGKPLFDSEHKDSYGAEVKYGKAKTLKFILGKDATVTLTGRSDEDGNEATFTLKDSTGKETSKTVPGRDSAKTYTDMVFENVPKGDVTFTMTDAQTYIKAVKIEYKEETKVSTSLKPISGLVAENGITATAKYAKVGDDHYFVLDFVEDDTLKSLDKLQYSVPTGGEFVKIYYPSLEITKLYSKVVFNEAGDDYIEESGHCYYAYKFTDADNTYTTLDAKIGSGTSSGQAR